MITLREEKGTQLTHQEMDENFKSVMGGHNFLHIQDQKPQGTPGGTFTSGAWWTRDLNTILTNTITGASLANNQITLPAGKYYVEASALARNVATNVVRITNGQGGYLCGFPIGTDQNNIGVPASVFGIIVLSGETHFNLEHRCQTTNNTHGFGRASNFITEVYSDIRIWRIGEYVAP